MAGINVLLNVAFTVPALWLFLSGQLFAPEFVEAIGWPWGEASGVTVAVIVFARHRRRPCGTSSTGS